WYAGRFGIRAVMQGDSTVSKAIAFPYALFHVAAMALFLVYPMLWIIFPGIRDRELLRLETVFIYCLVLSTAFIQALVQYSENPRFKTSVEPLIICMAVWIAIKFFARRRKSPEGR
ncbi:MAG: hypothetical protein U9N45_07960, partial [Gemmatimonadota bacterium]|nr:hypothetical protein [Gemmatimonadota bacterium]